MSRRLKARQAGTNQHLPIRDQAEPVTGNGQTLSQLVLIEQHQCLEHLSGSQQLDQTEVDALATPLRQACADLLDQRLGPLERILLPRLVLGQKFADPVRLGRQKPDAGFRDLLGRMKRNNPGSTINV